MPLFDIVFIVLLVLAFWKGYRKGLVYCLISTLAILLGIIVAVKLSGTVGTYLADYVPTLAFWTPLISFAVILFATVVGAKVIAQFVEKTLKTIALGWVNRALGGFLYCFMLCLVASTIVFYMNQMQFISSYSKTYSACYRFLLSFSPFAFEMIGNVLPFIQSSFEDLMNLFEEIEKTSTSA